MPGVYPQTLIVSSCDLVESFQKAIPQIKLRKADYAEIIQQIMIVMLDNFHTFRFSLAQLPNFMPLYPNDTLLTQDSKEQLAIAVHAQKLARGRGGGQLAGMLDDFEQRLDTVTEHHAQVPQLSLRDALPGVLHVPD